jgi:hypothetical protein
MSSAVASQDSSLSDKLIQEGVYNQAESDSGNLLAFLKNRRDKASKDMSFVSSFGISRNKATDGEIARNDVADDAVVQSSFNGTSKQDDDASSSTEQIISSFAMSIQESPFSTLVPETEGGQERHQEPALDDASGLGGVGAGTVTSTAGFFTLSARPGSELLVEVVDGESKIDESSKQHPNRRLLGDIVKPGPLLLPHELEIVPPKMPRVMLPRGSASKATAVAEVAVHPQAAVTNPLNFSSDLSEMSLSMAS